MIPRTVLMAQAVEALFTSAELAEYGNVIYHGSTTAEPNAAGVLAWQYKETVGAPVPLPSVPLNIPALKGWTNNYMEYFTRADSPTYNVYPGAPTMFAYSVHSYTDSLSTGIVTALAITNPGANYTVGYYTNVPLTGGTGTGLTGSFNVVNLPGPVTGLTELSQGTGYPGGVAASNVPTNALTGSGSGLLVNLLGVMGPPPYGAPLFGIGSSGGINYAVGDTVEPVYGSGTGAVYQVTAVTGTGAVTDLKVEGGGDGYTPGDALTAVIPGGAGFSAKVARVKPTTFNAHWAQAPRRFFQNRVLPGSPSSSINNPAAIPYSFMYPVADSPVAPPIDYVEP